RLDEIAKVAGQRRIALDQRLAAAALAPYAAARQRPLAKVVLAAVDRRSCDAGDLGNDRQGAVPGRLHLGRREQPPATLVELAAYRLPPLSDAILLDHRRRDTSVRDAQESP